MKINETLKRPFKMFKFNV